MKLKELLITLPLLCAAPALAMAGGERPNIVLFTVDDMDITSVNCYGNPLPNLTPNMDRLAAQACASCVPMSIHRSACRAVSR